MKIDVKCRNVNHQHLWCICGIFWPVYQCHILFMHLLIEWLAHSWQLKLIERLWNESRTSIHQQQNYLQELRIEWNQIFMTGWQPYSSSRPARVQAIIRAKEGDSRYYNFVFITKKNRSFLYFTLQYFKNEFVILLFLWNPTNKICRAIFR